MKTGWSQHRAPCLLALALAVAGPAHAAEGTGDPPAAPPPGDASRGRDLFAGAVPFRAGGAPCAACHAVGGHGLAFAASLGPDLATSFDGVALEALDGMLTDLPFPTMAPIYAGRALEPAERADLGAFLLSVTGKPPPSDAPLLLWAGAVALGLLAALRLLARRPQGSVRERLVARAPKSHGGTR